MLYNHADPVEVAKRRHLFEHAAFAILYAENHDMPDDARVELIFPPEGFPSHHSGAVKVHARGRPTVEIQYYWGDKWKTIRSLAALINHWQESELDEDEITYRISEWAHDRARGPKRARRFNTRSDYEAMQLALNEEIWVRAPVAT